MTSQQRPVSQAQQDKLSSLPTARIVKRVNYTEDLFSIWLQPSVPFSFKAGQYITIGAGGIERPYSIASAPHESLIELFIEYVLPEYGGKLTPLLWAQNVGDIVSMRPRPKGIFTFQSKYKNHVCVGTVTGIAPFISMARQYIHEKGSGHRFFFMEGASHHDEFVYDKELKEFCHKHPGSDAVFSVSRPQAARNVGWTGTTGRINNLVEEYLDKWKLTKEDTLVYACGHPGMIEDVKKRVTPKGWNFMEERFWKEEE